MNMRTIQLTERLCRYLVERSVRETAVQRALRRATQRMPQANMQIAPEQGQFLQLLVRLLRARRVLEVGTFTGYSALAMALALPAGGKIVTCDRSEEWTSIAKKHWKRAGVSQKIDLQLGSAIQTLKAIKGPFDLAFIDADKTNYWNYFERCLKLVHRGGLIAIDNTLWYGRVIDPSDQSADTCAVRAFNRRLARDRRVAVAMLPIGDGLTLALKL
jgi:predicted O-methyltransferase YrrM